MRYGRARAVAEALIETLSGQRCHEFKASEGCPRCLGLAMLQQTASETSPRMLWGDKESADTRGVVCRIEPLVVPLQALIVAE